MALHVPAFWEAGKPTGGVATFSDDPKVVLFGGITNPARTILGELRYMPSQNGSAPLEIFAELARQRYRVRPTEARIIEGTPEQGTSLVIYTSETGVWYYERVFIGRRNAVSLFIGPAPGSSLEGDVGAIIGKTLIVENG